MEEIRDVSFNLSRICRFCLSHSGVMSPIFDRTENAMPNVSTKIMTVVRVQLQINDGLPSMLCHRCLYMAEKSFEFKTQCETSDAMLRKYLSMMQATFSTPLPLDLEENTGKDLHKQQQSSNLPIMDSPLKRKRGRPRKEENLIFYSSPKHTSPDPEPAVPNEIKMVDGIASVVTVVDPRSDFHSNSDEELKKELAERIDMQDSDTVRSLAIARAKAKKYMGVVISTDENGLKTRRHLCKGCGKTFGHCSDLRKHVLVHTGERPFHCQLCDKTFSRSTNLNKHLKVHSGQKPFACPECPKSFASKGDLQRHQVIHSGIKPFRCNLCHQCFSRKDKLTRHVKLHGSPLSVRVNSYRAGWTGHNIGIADCDNEMEPERVDFDDFVADETDKVGDEDGDSSEEPLDTEKGSREDENENQSRDQIESMVINIDPFPLDGDTPDQLGVVKAETTRPVSDEESSTNDLTPLLCPYCTQSFPNASTLAAHVLTHAEKPHKCELCAKSFSRRRELLRHETVHTGVKPFSCPICCKAFARKDKLVRHKKIHDVRKPAQRLFCELCAVAFFKESLFKEHMDSHDVGDNSVEYVSEEDQLLAPKNGCIDSEDGNSDEEMDESESFLCLPLQQS